MPNYLINAASSLNDKNINMRTTHASTKCLTGNDCVLDNTFRVLSLGSRAPIMSWVAGLGFWVPPSVPGLTHEMGPGFRVSDPTESPGSQTERQKDRQTDRQTDRDRDRQTDREIERAAKNCFALSFVR